MLPLNVQNRMNVSISVCERMPLNARVVLQADGGHWQYDE
jgi:hypothetical protein